MAKLKSVVPWKAKEEPEERMQVVLVRDEESTDIQAADEAGEGLMWLLSLGPSGLRRAEGLAKSLGFPLDDKGRIVLDET